MCSHTSDTPCCDKVQDITNTCSLQSMFKRVQLAVFFICFDGYHWTIMTQSYRKGVIGQSQKKSWKIVVLNPNRQTPDTILEPIALRRCLSIPELLSHNMAHIVIHGRVLLNTNTCACNKCVHSNHRELGTVMSTVPEQKPNKNPVKLFLPRISSIISAPGFIMNSIWTPSVLLQ